jgi:hypothetical protein
VQDLLGLGTQGVHRHPGSHREQDVPREHSLTDDKFRAVGFIVAAALVLARHCRAQLIGEQPLDGGVHGCGIILCGHGAREHSLCHSLKPQCFQQLGFQLARRAIRCRIRLGRSFACHGTHRPAEMRRLRTTW